MLKNIMRRFIISVALMVGFHPVGIIAMTNNDRINSHLAGLGFIGVSIFGILLFIALLKSLERAEQASGGKLGALLAVLLFILLLIFG